MPVHYDVALAYVHDYFSSRVRELCGQFDLSFFLVEPVWVDDFLRKHQANEIKTRVLIDMASDAYQPDDPYFTLAREVKRAGEYVVDDPEKGAIMGHKAKFHTMLVEHHVPVPETIIVSRDAVSSFRDPDEVIEQLGIPCRQTSAPWGSGRQGVILEGHSRRICTGLQSSRRIPTPFAAAQSGAQIP